MEFCGHSEDVRYVKRNRYGEYENACRACEELDEKLTNPLAASAAKPGVSMESLTDQEKAAIYENARESARANLGNPGAQAVSLAESILEIRNLLNQAEGLGKWPKPISVGERLPEANTDCLVFAGEWCDAHYNGKDFARLMWGERVQITEVTHWIQMPPNPE